MPDGTSRFADAADGTPYHHFMGCSTFAEYTVVPEIALAKIDAAADLTTVCMLGCGVTTGVGAVRNTTAVEPGASVAVFGLGAIGIAVIQAAGGIVTDWTGGPAHDGGRAIAAANAGIHAEALAILQATIND